MSGLFRSFVLFASTQYRAMVSKRLAQYGLKYDDLLVEFDTVQTAIARTNKSKLVDRERRIKRAFDLSAKHKTLPPEHQEKNVLDHYLQPQLKHAEREYHERKLLNHY